VTRSPEEIGARLTYVGHATVLIELGDSRLVTDPLLRDRLLGVLRRHRGLDRSRLERVDAVLLSHLHPDHLDLPSLRALGASVPIVGPPGTAAFLDRRGFENVTELEPGEVTAVAGIGIRAVEARHARGRMFGFGRSGTVGYVLERGARIYFAGDTELFAGMSDLASGLDVALLPIWGWGPRLGPGHLDPEEAARALTLLRPRAAVPVHWGTLAPVGARCLWPWLFEAPARRFAASARRLAPEVDVRVLQPGQSISVAGAGSERGGGR
jgi:L-ascorbate metabolism protein UlaG (beta-lactamase superfamily)